MQKLPHHYTVTAQAAGDGDHDIELTAARLPRLLTTTPAEFGGPGDRWSPETLFVGAVGDCLVLTFRGLARRLNLVWSSVECDVTGTLDRADGALAFVGFLIDVRLRVPAGANVELARHVLERAEQTCLITNSLKGTVHMTATIDDAASRTAVLTTP